MRAAARSSNGRNGYSGRYFKVLNSDSEYGLSLLTDGRLNEGTIPNVCSVTSIVAPFMGPPLSECEQFVRTVRDTHFSKQSGK